MPNYLSRLCSGAIMGIILGFLVYQDTMKDIAKGLTAYLADEKVRFTDYQHDPPTLGVYVLSLLFMGGVFLGLYELLALILRSIFGTNRQTSDRPYTLPPPVELENPAKERF